MVDMSAWNEITMYEAVRNRALKGVMMHHQLKDALYFMGFHGFACFHKHREKEEFDTVLQLEKHFMKTKRKMLPKASNVSVDLMPSQFYTLQNSIDISADYKKQFTKNLLLEWHKWEKESRDFYEAAVHWCEQNIHIADRDFLMCFVEGCQKAADVSAIMIGRLSDCGFELSQIYGYSDYLGKQYDADPFE